MLKQTSKHEARWTFDLLHEVFHAAQLPEERTLELVEAEATSNERRESDEEVAASEFAGEVLLDGKADELEEYCVERANNTVLRLQQVAGEVAKEQGVRVGALASYLAFWLSWQGLTGGVQLPTFSVKTKTRGSSRATSSWSDILTVSKMRSIALCSIMP